MAFSSSKIAMLLPGACCAYGIPDNSRGIARYNLKILLREYAPAYACELGRLDTRLPFAELKRLSTSTPGRRR